MTFSSTVKFSTSMKCWCTMPMPAAIAALGSLIATGLPPISDLAAVGLIKAIEDRHQCRLAGAVFADNAVDGALANLEINVLVGVNRAETFVDALEFDSEFAHDNPSDTGRPSWRGAEITM
jgi:hypothetical protein